MNEIAELKAENETLKITREKLLGDLCITEESLKDCEEHYNRSEQEKEKYYQTLQEIKAIAENREIFCENCSFCCDEFTCDDCGYVKILQKITKAEEE